MLIQFEIEPFAVTSRGQSVTVNPKDISADIWARLALHGATQKIADAASGAKAAAEETGASIEEVTIASMQKAMDALIAGDWSTRVAGDGVSEETKVQRAIMRQAIKLQLGAKSPKWKDFDALPIAEQNAKLDANYAKNVEKLAPQVADEMKRREAARKAKAKLADGVEFTL